MTLKYPFAASGLCARRYNEKYKEGETAAGDGGEHGHNPYPPESPDGIAWLDGWIDGKNLKAAG